jgi:hypothetical protein
VCAAQENAPNIAVVLKIADQVEFQKAATDSWAVASRGLILSSGDKLRTGRPGSVAVLFVDDRSLLKLAEATEVTFSATRDGGTVSKRIWMGVGNLWAKVTKAEDPHFEVETPTSVASVKGSEFYSLEDEETGNTLHALTGQYLYKNEFGEVELSGGMTGQSDGQSPPRVGPTEAGALPDFGGGLEGYDEGPDGRERRILRIEVMDEEGERRMLVIPLIGPEEDE